MDLEALEVDGVLTICFLEIYPDKFGEIRSGVQEFVLPRLYL